LRLAAGASVASRAGLIPAHPGVRAADERVGSVATLKDSTILLEFDPQMRSRLWHLREGQHGERKVALTRWAASEYLLLGDGRRIEQFALQHQSTDAVNGTHGSGTRLRMTGVSGAQIEKNIEIQLFERYPGIAFYRVSYRNRSADAIALRGWTSADLHLLRNAATGADGTEPHVWSYCGSTHSDRRDWVQPVRQGFAQENFMGMTASDYGGGTPVVDLWRRDCGLAVGHLESTPELVSLPVSYLDGGANLAISARLERSLQPGENFPTLEIFVATHTGDYFATLSAYRRIMDDRGLKLPPVPEAAYEPIWCAWGYERDCTMRLIEDTLPKVQELGLRWAVIDDGWQSNVGDWKLSQSKFPRGDADMKRLLESIRSKALKPRLWFAPLAAAPGSDLLHDHTDMLLLDKDGAVQNISWWNSFYLCPAYEKTVTYTQELVRKFMHDWGFAGLKIDGQHLNGVAPCFNPAHRHARPEESVEKLQDFLHAIYQTGTQINPEAVMEWCPCGTSYSFYNFGSMNQAPASDPESSWQVRHKGKTLKALMGPSAAFAGDHVELSDGGDDFASTVGIGAIVSTKFTWPRDPKPKNSFLLTPQREQLWRKWIALYNERMLPRGTYRGELYDIGFDKPETHVVEKSGRLYYAFYARNWSGPVTLRGLTARRYRVRDYFNERELGEVADARNRLHLAFDRFLVLEAIPV
jgi:alpha-galactosidase